MTPTKKRPDAKKSAQIVTDAKRDQAVRQQGYREQALNIYPHICGRCGREFSGKRLRELTVHHKDHDHMNNPPDGSNWELLCLYCHDDEHQKSAGTGYHDASTIDRGSGSSLGHNPFAGLGNLIKPETEESDSD